MVEVWHGTEITQTGRMLVFYDVVLFPFHGSVCLKKYINTFKIRTGDFFSHQRLLYQTAVTCERNEYN